MSGAGSLFEDTAMGAERLRLDRTQLSAMPRARTVVALAVDYSATLPDGIRLPLELLVTGPGGGSVHRRLFRRVAPVIVTFRPATGGDHHVLLREVAHNRFSAKLVVSVAGDLPGRVT